MLHRHCVLALVTLLLTATSCGKDAKAPAPADKTKPADSSADKSADKPADKPIADKPADKPIVDKPADKPIADKPADKPAGPTWETYTSKDGGYTIDFPSKVEEKDQGGMKMVMAQFGMSAADTREATCGVVFLKLPDPKADPKTVLESAIARHKENATIIEDKDVKLGKHPGKSLVVETPKHRKWMRVYLVNGTIYITNCGGPFDRAAADGPIAMKTLDSFKLAK
jgi:hypothetical protein